jgi:hypothetical protein
VKPDKRFFPAGGPTADLEMFESEELASPKVDTVRHASMCKPFSNLVEPYIKVDNPEEESLKKYLNGKSIKQNSVSEISEDEGESGEIIENSIVKKVHSDKGSKVSEGVKFTKNVIVLPIKELVEIGITGNRLKIAKMLRSRVYNYTMISLISLYSLVIFTYFALGDLVISNSRDTN